MKFFTLDWWLAVQSLEDHDPVPDFRKHLDTIRDRLPPGLLQLQESISLHDSHLREIAWDADSNLLTIRLTGSNEQGGARSFQLTYKQVQAYRSTADPEIGLGGPHGYGDLGYDEADITDDGLFEHRLLFSSGIEIQIHFRDFELTWSDLP